MKLVPYFCLAILSLLDLCSKRSCDANGSYLHIFYFEVIVHTSRCGVVQTRTRKIPAFYFDVYCNYAVGHFFQETGESFLAGAAF